LIHQDPAAGPKAASGSAVDDRVRDLNKINNDHLTSQGGRTTTDNYYIPYSEPQTVPGRDSQTTGESGGTWATQQRQGPANQLQLLDGPHGGEPEVTPVASRVSTASVCNGAPPSLATHNATTDNSTKSTHLNMENRAKSGGGRPKPPDYDDAWYEEADGQFYNQYDWYQDENGEWQYDYRLEEQGLVQNDLGEWILAEEQVPSNIGQEGDRDKKSDLANSFRTKDDANVGSASASVAKVSSNKKNAQGQSDTSGPRPKPPDYDDAWYEEADGQFYNQYDWYQDENGEWQYDYRLEEQGLVQNELGEWVPEEDIKQCPSKANDPPHGAKADKQKPKVPSPTDRSKPMPIPSSDVLKSSSSTVFKGLSNFGSGLMGAATTAAKEAASNAALAVDSMADVADAAMEAMPEIELPQVGLAAKAAGTIVQPLSETGQVSDNVVEKTSACEKNKKEPVVQQRSSDGFSQLFSSSSGSLGKSKEAAASLSKVKSSLPPRPADYDDFWYQADNGNWYNEYDDMGYEFADEEILVVEEQETVLTTQILADEKGPMEVEPQKSLKDNSLLSQEQVQGTKVETKLTADTKPTKKQPRPEDYDDYWYQDDSGQWKNEYDDLGYNFEEEEDFYTEEELAKEEAELFRQKKDNHQPAQSTITQVKQTPASDTTGSAESKDAPSQPTTTKEKPTDYEDHWFQDYDGNWYNEYDQTDEDKATPPPLMPAVISTTPEVTSQSSNSVSVASKKEKKTVSFDKEDQSEHQLTSLVGGRTFLQNPKDRWQWAFTRIIQVGGEWQA
jgi:hypothetical protein